MENPPRTLTVSFPPALIILALVLVTSYTSSPAVPISASPLCNAIFAVDVDVNPLASDIV